MVVVGGGGEGVSERVKELVMEETALYINLSCGGGVGVYFIVFWWCFPGSRYFLEDIIERRGKVFFFLFQF